MRCHHISSALIRSRAAGMSIVHKSLDSSTWQLAESGCAYHFPALHRKHPAVYDVPNAQNGFASLTQLDWLHYCSCDFSNLV